MLIDKIMKKTDRKTAGLLAILLWGIGWQHFYMGNIIMGIICILFCWTRIPLIIGIIEGIVYLCHDDKRWDERYNVVKKEDLKISKEKLYDDLLKYEALKEKWLIEESEYKEKIKETKSEIKEIEKQEKSLKDKELKIQQKIVEDKKSLKKTVIIALVVGCVLLWLTILLALYVKSRN